MESRSLAQIEDVLYCIFSHLDPDLHSDDWAGSECARSSRRALVRLAVAHGNFTHIALAVLWRSLPSDHALKHLLCVVGIAKRRPRQNWWSEPSLELCGTPETHESGWKRFKEYSRLVRKIVVDPFVFASGDARSTELKQGTFWCQVSSMFGDAFILPRLQIATLSGSSTRYAVDMGAFHLLNPSMRQLVINFGRAGATAQPKLWSALSTCFQSARNLETLSLIVPFWVVDCESLAQSHPRLRHLRIDADVDPSCLATLATLPNLEHLSVRLSGSVNAPLEFKTLHSLLVSCHELDGAAALVSHMNAPELRTLSIHSQHDSASHLRQDLLHCILPLATRFPFLTAFHWNARQLTERKGGFYGPRDAGATLAELVEPLLPLRALRGLSLEFHGPIVPYSSTDFHKMADAWPDLETFRVEHALERDAAQHADHESFLSFARLCPRLQSLRLPSVKLDPDVELAGALFPTKHGLRELLVDDVVCPGRVPRPDEQTSRDECRGESEVRHLAQRIFPFAIIRFPANTTSRP